MKTTYKTFFLNSVLLAFCFWLCGIIVNIIPILYPLFKDGKIIEPLIVNISMLFFTVGSSIFIYSFIDAKMRRNEEKIRSEENQLFLKNIHAGIFENIMCKEIYNVLKRDFFLSPIYRSKLRITLQISENLNGYEITKNIEFNSSNSSVLEETVEEVIAIPLNETINGNKRSLMFKYNDESKWIKVSDKLEEDNVNKRFYRKAVNEQGEPAYCLKLKKGQEISVVNSVFKKYNGFVIEDRIFSTKSIVGAEIIVIKPKDCTFKLEPTFEGVNDVKIFGETEIRFENISAILVGQGIIYSVSKKS